MASSLAWLYDQLIVEKPISLSSWPNEQPISAPTAVHRQQKQQQLPSLLRWLLQQLAPPEQRRNPRRQPLQSDTRWHVPIVVQTIWRNWYSEVVHSVADGIGANWWRSTKSRQFKVGPLCSSSGFEATWCWWCWGIVNSQGFRLESRFKPGRGSKEKGFTIWKVEDGKVLDALWSRKWSEACG